jgi:signal recognition particle receptor subunit beta
LQDYKILFTGPPGVGKTTAIACVSDHDALNTDVANYDTSLNKTTTTVGFDYGILTLQQGEFVRLFGTPGQLRFDFLWKILAKNAVGIVILIDNSRPDPLDDLTTLLKGFADELKTVPCVIGISRLESNPLPSLNNYADFLFKYGLIAPILATDVRRAPNVLQLIDSLLLQIEASHYEDSHDN